MNDRIAELRQRHRAFWHRDLVDRPLLTAILYEPLAPMDIPVARSCWQSENLRLMPDMLDPALFAAFEQGRSDPEALFRGDIFTVRAAFRRIPWVEAILGCEIWADRVSGSIWSQPFLESVASGAELHLAPDNPWLVKLLAFTQELVSRYDGSYLATLTLMRGPIDLARAVLGDEQMCLAIYDSAQAFRALLDAISRVFIAVAEAQLAIIPQLDGGYVSPFGIWAPGKVVCTQADISAILSPRTYAETVLPFEDQVCRPFAYSTIHLHSGFLHVVEPLLDAELPRAIEVALDTGSTPITTHDLVPLFRRILERKPLLIHGHMTASELDELVASLPPHGLHICAWLDAGDLASWRPPQSY